MLFVFCRAIIVHKPYCKFFQTALFFCVMYIRRTHTNNSSTGERYYTHRLVVNQRVDGKPCQLTLLNLGRHFSVDQDWWASLCVRIEQLMSHQAELLPIELPAAGERAAAIQDEIKAVNIKMERHLAKISSEEGG